MSYWRREVLLTLSLAVRRLYALFSNISPPLAIAVSARLTTDSRSDFPGLLSSGIDPEVFLFSHIAAQIILALLFLAVNGPHTRLFQCCLHVRFHNNDGVLAAGEN